MDKQDAIKLFEQQKVRAHWDEDEEKWFFSITDVIQILTQSDRPRKYWSDLKKKLKKEGSELSEKIGQLKMVGEATTTEISKEKKPKNFKQSKIIANQGGTIAGNTRKEIEEKTGKKIVNKLSAKNYLDTKKELE